MANNFGLIAGLLLVCVALASALPSPGFTNLRSDIANLHEVPRSNTLELRPAAEPMRLKGGGLPPTKTIVMTCLGGALGAFMRTALQAWTDSITKHGPWKHIVGVNFLGAFMLGIVTHGKFSKDLAPMLIPAFRIVSAIITVDAMGLYKGGKETEAAMYICIVVPLNLLANHLGREVGGSIL